MSPLGRLEIFMKQSNAYLGMKCSCLLYKTPPSETALLMSTRPNSSRSIWKAVCYHSKEWCHWCTLSSIAVENYHRPLFHSIDSLRFLVQIPCTHGILQKQDRISNAALPQLRDRQPGTCSPCGPIHNGSYGLVSIVLRIQHAPVTKTNVPNKREKVSYL